MFEPLYYQLWFVFLLFDIEKGVELQNVVKKDK